MAVDVAGSMYGLGAEDNVDVPQIGRDTKAAFFPVFRLARICAASDGSWQTRLCVCRTGSLLESFSVRPLC